MERFAKQYNRLDLKLSPECHAALEAHHWPGNVRELQNAVERAVIMSEPGAPLISSVLGLPGIKPVSELSAPSVNDATDLKPPVNGDDSVLLGDAHVSLAALEKEHILRVLSACADNRTRAADALQISIRTLRNKLHEYRLAKDE